MTVPWGKLGTILLVCLTVFIAAGSESSHHEQNTTSTMSKDKTGTPPIDSTPPRIQIQPPSPVPLPNGTMPEPWQGHYCTQYYTKLWGLQPVALHLSGERINLTKTLELWRVHLGEVEIKPWVSVHDWHDLHALRDRQGGLAVIAFTDMALTLGGRPVNGIACNGQAVISVPGLECLENLVLHEAGHLIGKVHLDRGFMREHVLCWETYY